MRTLLNAAALLLGAFLVQQVQARPEIPESLQLTYGEFANALVKGEAEKAIGFYAEDAVVLVDAQHVYHGRSEIREGFLQVYLEAPRGEDGRRTNIEVERVVVGEGVVVLAGRYSSPVGTSGIYSNTWQRQEDGAWKLAISTMTFEATESAHGSSGEAFACTQVLGFSQSMEWFSGSSLVRRTEGGSAPEAPPLKRGTFLPGWQARFFMGAAIEDWTDPEYPGWSGSHEMAYETPANCPLEEVDRVVFNVSGAARSPEEWAAAIDSVAKVIRSKYPADPRVVMQPAVGAPEGMCQEVRAARNHPFIAKAIRMAAKRGSVTAGPEPTVASCDQFRDELGHLTEDGAKHVQQGLKARYRKTPNRAGR